jgi:hypothetical protein
MSNVLKGVLSANTTYVGTFGSKADLALPPNALMRDLLAKSLETAELCAQWFREVGKGPGSAEAQFSTGSQSRTPRPGRSG